jgi:hypothetical protein
VITVIGWPLLKVGEPPDDRVCAVRHDDQLAVQDTYAGRYAASAEPVGQGLVPGDHHAFVVAPL